MTDSKYPGVFIADVNNYLFRYTDDYDDLMQLFYDVNNNFTFELTNNRVKITTSIKHHIYPDNIKCIKSGIKLVDMLFR